MGRTDGGMVRQKSIPNAQASGDSTKDTIGILLAGGTGSRLFPTTLAVSKHVLPIYDKPTIFYSLSMLMLAKVKTVSLYALEMMGHYKQLLGDGSFIGMTIFYEIQAGFRNSRSIFNL